MDQNQFTKVVDEQVKRSTDVLIVKAKEYASDTDRLANFKVAAALQNVSVRQALAGMMAKHTYSIFEMCGSDKQYTDEQWDEKITDHVNYLLLLKAVTVEENAPQYDLKSVRVSDSYYFVQKFEVETAEEAGSVLSYLLELIQRYGCATVADLYENVGLTPRFADGQWGWTANGGPMVVIQTEHGYSLSLPAPKMLNYGGDSSKRDPLDLGNAEDESDKNARIISEGLAAQRENTEKASITYQQYSEAADNRSKLKRLEAIFKDDLTPDQVLSQATSVIFP